MRTNVILFGRVNVTAGGTAYIEWTLDGYFAGAECWVTGWYAASYPGIPGDLHAELYYNDGTAMQGTSIEDDGGSAQPGVSAVMNAADMYAKTNIRMIPHSDGTHKLRMTFWNNDTADSVASGVVQVSVPAQTFGE